MNLNDSTKLLTSSVWQYEGSKIRQLFKNWQRKLLNFGFWINVELAKIGHHFVKKFIQKLILISVSKRSIKKCTLSVLWPVRMYCSKLSCAKIIPKCSGRMILAKWKLVTIHHDSSPRPPKVLFCPPFAYIIIVLRKYDCHAVHFLHKLT